MTERTISFNMAWTWPQFLKLIVNYGLHNASWSLTFSPLLHLLPTFKGIFK